MDIEIKAFSELNLADPFFDSLKEDYPEFVQWFEKKARGGAEAYVFIEEGRIRDFLYLKIEDEALTDVTPSFPEKKRLKVGTFKIDNRHSRRGERFMKKIMDRAIADNVDEVYVTMFPKPELNKLRKLFLTFGFEQTAVKDHGERGAEIVLVKNMRAVKGDIVKDYPFVAKANSYKWILGIYPIYHTKLFPDSILRNENPYDLVKDISPTNSIYKIYICWMRDVEMMEPGDLVLIYRTSDNCGPANYRSVITSVCTVSEIKTLIDFDGEDDFVKYTNQYSIFKESELRSWYKSKNNFKVIKMLYNVAFKRRVIRKTLLEQVGLSSGDYWGFMRISDKQFDEIIKLGEADERYFVD